MIEKIKGTNWKEVGIGVGYIATCFAAGFLIGKLINWIFKRFGLIND